MEKKKSRFLPAVLWLLFLGATAVIVYLSFQNGEDSRELCMGVIEQVAQRYYEKENVSSTELNQIAYWIRQMGRMLAFLLIGMLGTATIHASCTRINWFGKTVIAAGALLLIAFFTEKLKMYIPTRHYSHDEMVMSIMAAMTGFLIVTVITITVRAVKGVVRLVATALH